MFRIVLLLLLVLRLPSPDEAAGASSDDRGVRHDLRIVLDPATSSLRGEDTLTLPAEGRPLTLLLSRRARIEEVSVAGLPAVRYRFASGRLTVFLPTTATGRVSVRVAYRAVFDDPVPENPAHDEDPSYGVTAAITPRGAFLGAGARWSPVLPGSAASFRVRIEAPAGMEAVTSGRLTGRGQTDGRTFTTWESTTPLDPLTVAAGPYRIGEQKVPGAELYTFLYPANAHLSPTYLEAAAGYLDLYQGLFGPYPFTKFAVAENFFPTGYGFPSWTLLGSTVVRLPFIVETSLGHEIAHSWWGNGVLVDYRRGNWSEGLTTYVADHLYKERESEEAAQEYRLKILRDYTTLVSPEEAYPLSRFTSRKTAADQAIGYGKSAMVFHMARQKAGEEAFWKGLRAVAAGHLRREASWDDFGAAWQSLSGTDMSAFFRQWVERPGAPLLELAGIEAVEEEGRWRVRGRLLQRQPYYELAVPVRLETAGEALELTVPVQLGSTEFELRSAARPVRLAVDPRVDLFRRLHPQEIPPTVNSIRSSDHLLAVAADDLPEETVAAAGELLKALRQSGARVVRERDLDPEDLAAHDLLLLGLPTDPSLRPPIPPALGFSSGRFTVDGTEYARTDAALFAALPHPTDPSRRSAIFLPLSADAARQAIRKIPHYGKYSYLVFTGGENRAKGTWPISASPLVHDFDPMEADP